MYRKEENAEWEKKSCIFFFSLCLIVGLLPSYLGQIHGFFLCDSFVFVCIHEIIVSRDLTLNVDRDRYLLVSEELLHFSNVVYNLFKWLLVC